MGNQRWDGEPTMEPTMGQEYRIFIGVEYELGGLMCDDEPSVELLACR
jgi:hypothetical protein